MSNDAPREKALTPEELEAVAGGANAVEQIKQIVDETQKRPENTMQQMNPNPPNQMYPSSAPYNM